MDCGECPVGNQQGAKMEIMGKLGSNLELVVREAEFVEVVSEDEEGKEHSR